ncbi:hypothetical protein D3C85_885980 [compost metagenome]
MTALDQLADVQVTQGVAQAFLAADLGQHPGGQQVRGEQQARCVDGFGVGDLDRPLAEIRHRRAVTQAVAVSRPQRPAQAAVVSLVGALTDPVGCMALDEHIQIALAQRPDGVVRGAQCQVASGQRARQVGHR